MSAEVDRILAQRRRRASHGAEAATIAGAVALHLLLVAVALFLPHLRPPPKPLDFVPVTVIPAQALGVHRPAPPRRAAPAPPVPAAEPPAPEPKPAPKAREEEPPPPKVPKTAEKVPVLPEKPDKTSKVDKAKKPEPVKPTAAPPVPAATPPRTPPGAGRSSASGGNPNSPPNATAVGETGDQAGRRGGAEGTPLGTTAFGSRVGVDNSEFTYGYYLDRLLSLIDANWTRPEMGGGVYAIISFHIQRGGSLTDLRVAQSSGYNSFDLAALRAVQNAAPFPPLPRAYNHDDLGIRLIVK